MAAAGLDFTDGARLAAGAHRDVPQSVAYPFVARLQAIHGLSASAARMSFWALA